MYPALANKARFTTFLRDSFSILGPMGAPGIDLVQTMFPVSVQRPTHPSGKPDIADVLYAVHRCCHAHGDELPDGFELIQDAAGPPERTRMAIQRGRIQLSDRMIFGLLAVAVLSPANHDQVNPKLDDHFLTFGYATKPIINEWWGRSQDFQIIADQVKTPLVKLDFGNW